MTFKTTTVVTTKVVAVGPIQRVFINFIPIFFLSILLFVGIITLLTSFWPQHQIIFIQGTLFVIVGMLTTVLSRMIYMAWYFNFKEEQEKEKEALEKLDSEHSVTDAPSSSPAVSSSLPPPYYQQAKY